MDEKPLRIAIVAGEPSGDRQGAALILALREMAAPRRVEAWGIGGHFLREAGVALRHNSDPWASIGVAEALAHLPRLLRMRADMKRALRRDPPDALVVIDAGAFNVPLARWAKNRRLCPVFYYFPPGSWRKPGAKPNAKSNPKSSPKSNLPAATDRIVTPFPWSEALLQSLGADAHFVGHPLLDMVKPTLPDREFYERFGLNPQRPLVALLPGSRQGEIRHILPVLVQAASEISRRISGVQFILALVSSSTRAQAEDLIRREQGAARRHLLMTQAGDKLAHLAHQTLAPPLPQLATNEGLTVPSKRSLDESRPRERPGQPSGPAPLVICEGLTWDALAHSDLVLTKSGTATLEAMILKKPMVIVYRGSRLTALEWRLRRRSLGITHIGLPNILASERLFAELIQDEATPDAIADLAVELLLEPGRILALKERLGDLVRDNLGESGGIRRAAGLLLDLIVSRAAAPQNVR